MWVPNVDHIMQESKPKSSCGGMLSITQSVPIRSVIHGILLVNARSMGLSSIQKSHCLCKGGKLSLWDFGKRCLLSLICLSLVKEQASSLKILPYCLSCCMSCELKLFLSSICYFKIRTIFVAMVYKCVIHPLNMSQMMWKPAIT